MTHKHTWKLMLAMLAGAALFAAAMRLERASDSLAALAAADPAESEFRELPEPEDQEEFPLTRAIRQRRSVRAFKPDRLTDKQTSLLLFAAQGVTCPERSLRAAPSAGATYPLEVFIFDPDGIHRYRPERHALETLSAQDQRDSLAQAALNQTWIAQAPTVIVIAAEYDRTTGRYGQRGIRYVHIETGHAAQNIHLQAVALGLASVPVGAFEDDAVRDLAGLPPALEPLYIIPVGHAAEEAGN